VTSLSVRLGRNGLEEGWYARSSESPRQSSSSMFLVMIRVTSCSSLFSVSRAPPPALAVRVSWYNLAVFDMKVSEAQWVS
jgi:hypothetical protein